MSEKILRLNWQKFRDAVLIDSSMSPNGLAVAERIFMAGASEAVLQVSKVMDSREDLELLLIDLALEFSEFSDEIRQDLMAGKCG